MQRWNSNADLLALGELMQHPDIRRPSVRSQFLWPTVFWTVAHCLRTSSLSPDKFCHPPVSFPQAQGLFRPQLGFILLLYMRGSLLPVGLGLHSSGQCSKPLSEGTSSLSLPGPLCSRARVSFHLLTFLPLRVVIFFQETFCFFSMYDCVRPT